MENKTNPLKLVSFDIFDTTLIRKCGVPNNIFYILSKVLFPDNFALQNDFYNWRIHAEELYYMSNTTKEADLFLLYELLPNHLCHFYKANEIAEMEMNIEFENLVANAEIRGLIEDYRKNGFTVCFISDMYLDSQFLTSILLSQGCAVDGDKVFVSNEFDKRKALHGELYSVVRDHFPNIIKWIHYGDNYESDYICAKKLGISAIYYQTNFSISEQKMLNRFRDYTFYQELSVLIGYQRCCRLVKGNSADVANASDLIASLYIPYLFYVSSIVKRQNIHSLFFLSRDGNILYEMAKCYFSRQSDLGIRYLFVSRKSLIQSCFESLSRDEILELLGKKSLIGERVSSILSSLQISKDLFKEIDFERFQRIEDEDLFFNIISSKREIILKESHVKRLHVIDYLKKEGFLESSDNIGIVDVGWIGTTRLMLNKLKKKYGKKSTVSFFYLGYEDAILYSDKGTYYSFFPKSVNSLHVPYFTELIENYYSAAMHTSTIDYNYCDNDISPVLENNTNEDVQSLAMTNIDVCKMIIDYIKGCRFLDFSASYNVWGIGFLKLFASNPRWFNYSTFEKVYYYDRKFYKRITLKNLIRFFLSGSTGQSCIDEFSLFCTYGIRIKRRYTLYSVYRIVKMVIDKCKHCFPQ